MCAGCEEGSKTKRGRIAKILLARGADPEAKNDVSKALEAHQVCHVMTQAAATNGADARKGQSTVVHGDESFIVLGLPGSLTCLWKQHKASIRRPRLRRRSGEEQRS